MAQRFRTKIVEIEATRWTGDNLEELEEWTEQQFALNPDKRNLYGEPTDITAHVYDELHETWVGVKTGQWIVRGAKSEYYPCDDETFHWKYEEITEDALQRPTEES